MRLELVLSRIINGYLYVPEHGLEIRYPDSKIEYKSNLIYYSLFDSFALSQDELSMKCGLWNLKSDRELESKKEEIDNLKAQLYKAFFNVSQANALRSKLKDAKKSYQRLHQKKTVLDKYSAEGVAEYARLAFFIEKCTYKDNELYDWEDWTIPKAIDYWKENLISDDVIRELARNDIWTVMYYASKNTNMPLFCKSAADLHMDQKRLITWSDIYNNVGQMEDCPSEDIVNDDDAFDGFLVLKRKEKSKSKRKQGREDGLTEKQRKAEELYLVPDIKDPMWKQNIKEMNSRQANVVIEGRKAALNKLKEGETLKHGAFTDVKQRMMIEANKAEQMRRKGF